MVLFGRVIDILLILNSFYEMLPEKNCKKEKEVREIKFSFKPDNICDHFT